MSQPVITRQMLNEAIDNSDKRPRKKRRLKRRLKDERILAAVQAELTSRALKEGVISFDDDMNVLIDFDAIISFIEKLLPLIIQLIGLFG